MDTPQKREKGKNVNPNPAFDAAGLWRIPLRPWEKKSPAIELATDKSKKAGEKTA